MGSEEASEWAVGTLGRVFRPHILGIWPQKKEQILSQQEGVVVSQEDIFICFMVRDLTTVNCGREGAHLC